MCIAWNVVNTSLLIVQQGFNMTEKVRPIDLNLHIAAGYMFVREDWFDKETCQRDRQRGQALGSGSAEESVKQGPRYERRSVDLHGCFKGRTVATREKLLAGISCT
jgi:hypothetical protein